MTRKDVVLIDLHQLNVKTTSDIQISDMNTRQPHIAKNRTRRTTTRNIRFPNQMIEQINIALDEKVKNFSSLGH